MKVHFILPHVNTFWFADVHHGLMSISSVLKSHGHDVSLTYIKKMPSRDDILEPIRKIKPDIIGFSTTTHQVEYVKQWSQWVKEEFNLPTICGGTHVILFPEQVINFPGMDMVCVGEGEYPMLELADNPERTDIENLWFKKDGRIIRNSMRPLIASLDDLPFPDYDLFDYTSMVKDRGGDSSVLVSRGCPYSCTYCSNHALRDAQQGKGVFLRVRSVDNTLLLLKKLAQKYPINHFTFADDIFGIHKKWALEFCGKYPREFNLKWECNLRPENVDEELMQGLKSANCVQVDMGIEAGNEQIRKEVLNRKMSNDQIIKAFDMAHRFGIKTASYNMVGLPGETPDMIKETISLNKRIAPDQIIISIFYPYPGTQLYEVCEKEGYLGEKHSASYMTESVLNLPTITRPELEKLYTEFYLYAISRRIRWYPAPLRFSVMALVSAFAKVFGKRAIEVLLKYYAPFLRVISLLETKRYSTH